MATCKTIPERRNLVNLSRTNSPHFPISRDRGISNRNFGTWIRRHIRVVWSAPFYNRVCNATCTPTTRGKKVAWESHRKRWQLLVEWFETKNKVSYIAHSPSPRSSLYITVFSQSIYVSIVSLLSSPISLNSTSISSKAEAPTQPALTPAQRTPTTAEAGLDPTVINGGVINSIKSTAKLGKGEWAVIESDESDGSFLNLPITYSILTNVDKEHLDYYNNFSTLKKYFKTVFYFVYGRLPGQKAFGGAG